MSHLIRYLELAGREARSTAAALNTLSRTDVAPEVRSAVERGDKQALAMIFELRPALLGYVSAPDREPPPVDVPDDVPEPDQQEPEAA